MRDFFLKILGTLQTWTKIQSTWIQLCNSSKFWNLTAKSGNSGSSSARPAKKRKLQNGGCVGDEDDDSGVFSTPLQITKNSGGSLTTPRVGMKRKFGEVETPTNNKKITQFFAMKKDESTSKKNE